MMIIESSLSVLERLSLEMCPVLRGFASGLDKEVSLMCESSIESSHVQ